MKINDTDADFNQKFYNLKENGVINIVSREAGRLVEAVVRETFGLLRKGVVITSDFLKETFRSYEERSIQKLELEGMKNRNFFGRILQRTRRDLQTILVGNDNGEIREKMNSGMVEKLWTRWQNTFAYQFLISIKEGAQNTSEKFQNRDKNRTSLKNAIVAPITVN